jgi:hypothetical protein
MIALFLSFGQTPPGGLRSVCLAYQPVVLFSHNKPATNNQPAVLFSQNKSAPAIGHQPNEQAHD